MVDVNYPTEEYYMPSLPKMEKPKIEGMNIMYASVVHMQYLFFTIYFGFYIKLVLLKK